MTELRLKLGKFFIILGAVSLILFVFSLIAESVNSYLLFIGVLLILFGTILRKKPKTEMSKEDKSPSSKRIHRSRHNRFDQSEQTGEEDTQIRRSRR